jgi:hydroxyacylglutathione hydrolase
MVPSARTLQESLAQRLVAYPDFLQILPAHGAGSACGKALGAVPMTTLGYERRFNRALKLAGVDKEGFVKDILHGQPNPPLYFATMKRVNRDGIAVTGGAPRGHRLSPQRFTEVQGRADTRVLDVRMDRAAFDAGHAPGAIAAPLRSTFFAMAAGSFLETHTPIVLMVEHEDDVELAARQLYRIGLDGLVGWITLEDAREGGLLTAQTERIDFADFDPTAARRAGEILDVRTTAEFEEHHLEGAHSMPYTRLRSYLPNLSKEKTLYVHCASGKRASLATAFLVAEGFQAVHVDGMFGTCGARCRTGG